MSNEVSIVGAKIRKARIENGHTLNSLSEALEKYKPEIRCSVSGLHKIENGRVQSLNLARIKAIAEILDVDESYLLYQGKDSDYEAIGMRGKEIKEGIKNIIKDE